MRPAAAAILIVLVLVVPAGCEQTPDDEMVRPRVTELVAPRLPVDLPTLPVGTGAVSPRSSVSLVDGTLVVDGRRIGMSPLSIQSYAVVTGGIFFLNGRELWFTDLTTAKPTAFTDVVSLVGSERGRLIGFLDLGHGPRDRYGTPLALALAYDARSGKPRIASYDGMGEVGKDDLARLYADSGPEVIGFNATGLIVKGVGPVVEIPLRRGLQDRGRSPR